MLKPRHHHVRQQHHRLAEALRHQIGDDRHLRDVERGLADHRLEALVGRRIVREIERDRIRLDRSVLQRGRAGMVAEQCAQPHRHLNPSRARRHRRGRPSPAARAYCTCRARVRRRRAAGACLPRRRGAFRLSPDIGDILAADDHNAVIIGDHGIAGHDIDAGADHGHVDRAERRLDRALGRDRPGPYRKAHLAQRSLRRGTPASMTSPTDAARFQRGREQIAEHAVGIVGGAADHQNVARPALLDRDMDHPVVAGLRQHGDRGAGRLARPPTPVADTVSSGRCGRRPHAPSRCRARRDASRAQHRSD